MTADERSAAERWAAQSAENGRAWALVGQLWDGLGAADEAAIEDLRAEARAAADARRGQAGGR